MLPSSSLGRDRRHMHSLWLKASCNVGWLLSGFQKAFWKLLLLMQQRPQLLVVVVGAVGVRSSRGTTTQGFKVGPPSPERPQPKRQPCGGPIEFAGLGLRVRGMSSTGLKRTKSNMIGPKCMDFQTSEPSTRKGFADSSPVVARSLLQQSSPQSSQTPTSACLFTKFRVRSWRL